MRKARFAVPGRVGSVVVLAVALVSCGGGSHQATRASSTTRAPTSTSTTSAEPSTTTSTTTLRRPEGWTTVADAPIGLGRYAVWTGTEYIGGPAGCCDDIGGNQVVAYRPAQNAWRTLRSFPLLPRSGEAAAWTGHEMVVVGGRQAVSAADSTQSDAVPTATGAALDPAANTWRTIASMPAPMPLPLGAVWTGDHVVVFDHTHTFRYDPSTDRWSAGAPPPFARDGVVVVSTGHEMLVWVGADASPGSGPPPRTLVHADGAAYDPVTNRWRPIPSAPVPARTASNAVWTGRQMILWGGVGADGTSGKGDRGRLGKGAAYDPTTGTWHALPASPLKARVAHQMVWTGREVLVWGGTIPSSSPDPVANFPRDGAAYDPATNTWRSLPAAPPAPPALFIPFSAVWTGDVALFIGGSAMNAQGVGPLGLAYAPGR